jgi:hypothetical protein
MPLFVFAGERKTYRHGFTRTNTDRPETKPEKAKTMERITASVPSSLSSFPDP